MKESTVSIRVLTARKKQFIPDYHLSISEVWRQAGQYAVLQQRQNTKKNGQPEPSVLSV
jgi:hypothetical protein